ncbi:hypothetical protein QJQ45_030225, partial [Haematococcus lacustris]
ASQKKRKRPVFPETSAAGKPQSLTKDQTSEELSHDATQWAPREYATPYIMSCRACCAFRCLQVPVTVGRQAVLPGSSPAPIYAAPYAHPRLATRSSPRIAAAQAQLTPPVQLGIWDPKLLAQIKAAMGLLTTASVLEHLMRGPCPHWVPPAGQVIQRLVRPAKSQRHAKYVRGLLWCHERIRKSMQRPLELRIYEGLEALSPIGKEYQQGYKLVNDRLPKGRQRLHRAAEYRRGNDGRARSNA